MKRISLEELLSAHPNDSYQQQYARILNLLEQGRLKPVKKAGTNGKKPALSLSYWITEEQEPSYQELEEELKYGLEPLISIEYYLSHLQAYQEDRPWVLMLNRYLKENRFLLEQPESCNERSFEIWSREKFLTREQGMKILKRCKIELDFLNLYETAEPFAYYSHTREIPQNMLILENKDTFFSMRRFLLEGHFCVLGVKFGTLIYGGGKRIVKSFQDFALSAEPYMKAEGNKIYYFGDLDYEGIGIYESLARQCRAYEMPVPFTAAYEKMLDKAKGSDALPNARESQNQNLKGDFFAYFPEHTAARMKKILEMGKYIPQEILSIQDFYTRERNHLPQDLSQL